MMKRFCSINIGCVLLILGVLGCGTQVTSKKPSQKKTLENPFLKQPPEANLPRNENALKKKESEKTPNGQKPLLKKKAFSLKDLAKKMKIKMVHAYANDPQEPDFRSRRKALPLSQVKRTNKEIIFLNYIYLKKKKPLFFGIDQRSFQKLGGSMIQQVSWKLAVLQSNGEKKVMPGRKNAEFDSDYGYWYVSFRELIQKSLEEVSDTERFWVKFYLLLKEGGVQTVYLSFQVRTPLQVSVQRTLLRASSMPPMAFWNTLRGGQYVILREQIQNPMNRSVKFWMQANGSAQVGLGMRNTEYRLEMRHERHYSKNRRYGCVIPAIQYLFASLSFQNIYLELKSSHRRDKKIYFTKATKGVWRVITMKPKEKMILTWKVMFPSFLSGSQPFGKTSRMIRWTDKTVTHRSVGGARHHEDWDDVRRENKALQVSEGRDYLGYRFGFSVRRIVAVSDTDVYLEQFKKVVAHRKDLIKKTTQQRKPVFLTASSFSKKVLFPFQDMNKQKGFLDGTITGSSGQGACDGRWARVGL